MKQRIIIAFKLLLYLSLIIPQSTGFVSAQSNTRWWQREIPLPSPAEKINPEYLSKRRELEQAWDQYHRDLKARAHFRSLGQKTPSLDRAVSSSRSLVNSLENDLSKIPMCLTITTTPSEQHEYKSYPESQDVEEMSQSQSDDPALQGWSGIRVTLKTFHHVYDPNGLDWRSHPQLGDVAAYVIRVYSTKAMQGISSVIAMAEEFGYSDWGDVGLMRADSQYVTAVPKGARGMMTAENQESTFRKIQSGAIIQFILISDLPYADIPLPPGIYYLEYSLVFPHARNSMFEFCHPNYKGRSRDESAEYNTSWGPSKVRVVNGIAKQVFFAPTLSISGYKYLNDPIRNGMAAFENSAAFKDWVSFLLWKGTFVPSREAGK